MENGYVKLWRKSIDSRVFKNEGLWKVWTWCLMRASHKKERWVSMKTGRGVVEVKILKGQFIFGREKASEFLGMKPSTLWGRMQKLKKMQNLDIKTDRQYSIVTVLNWGIYQGDKKKTDSKADRQPTGNRQATDTNKNVENGDNVKEDIYTPNLKQFVGDFIKYINDNNPTMAPRSKTIFESSLDTMEKLTRIDKHEEEFVFDIIRWATKDDFWQNQVYSLAGLRKKNSDGLMKFQNIVTAYNKRGNAKRKLKLNTKAGRNALAVKEAIENRGNQL